MSGLRSTSLDQMTHDVSISGPSGHWCHAQCVHLEESTKVFKLSADQQAVAGWKPKSWAAAARGIRARCIAHAGSGKTTALLALSKNLLARAATTNRPWLRLVYLCFNRASAESAQLRFPAKCGTSGVDCRTIHSALLSFVSRYAIKSGVPRFECPYNLGGAKKLDRIADVLDAADNDSLRKRCASRLKVSSNYTSAVDTERRIITKYAWNIFEQFSKTADAILSEEKHLTLRIRRQMDESDSQKSITSDSPLATRRLAFLYARILYEKAMNFHDTSVPCTQTVMPKIALSILQTDESAKLGWASYDTLVPHAILVDEGQDLTDCVLLILELQRQRGPSAIFVCGDEAQTLYRFAGASSHALRDSKVTGEARDTLFLRRSFRFGPIIAEEANRTLWLKRHYDKAFSYQPIIGCGANNGTIRTWGSVDDLNHLPPAPEEIACVCRTNKGIIECAAMILRLRPHARLDLGRGLEPLLTLLADMYRLYSQEKGATSIHGYDSFEELAAASKVVLSPIDDAEIDDLPEEPTALDPIVRQATQVVSELTDGIPSLLANCRRWTSGASIDDFNTTENIVFYTAHRAKGLEWKHVLVYEDFCDIMETPEKIKVRLYDDEINLWHVAITRAQQSLFLPSKFQAFREYHMLQEYDMGLPASTLPRLEPASAAIKKTILPRHPQSLLSHPRAIPPPPVALPQQKAQQPSTSLHTLQAATHFHIPKPEAVAVKREYDTLPKAHLPKKIPRLTQEKTALCAATDIPSQQSNTASIHHSAGLVSLGAILENSQPKPSRYYASRGYRDTTKTSKKKKTK